MTRSENGKFLPFDSDEMTGLTTYLQWISKDIPVYANVPWLGVPQVEGYEEGEPEAGAEVYATTCSACHGQNGEGLGTFPPLWGDQSYNDGAGMSRPETLAGFAFHNMPLGNPNLTKEQAEDVAIFVNTQPRPKYERPQ